MRSWVNFPLLTQTWESKAHSSRTNRDHLRHRKVNDTLRVGGRGLRLVGRLSVQWGWTGELGTPLTVWAHIAPCTPSPNPTRSRSEEALPPEREAQPYRGQWHSLTPLENSSTPTPDRGTVNHLSQPGGRPWNITLAADTVGPAKV